MNTFVGSSRSSATGFLNQDCYRPFFEHKPWGRSLLCSTGFPLNCRIFTTLSWLTCRSSSSFVSPGFVNILAAYPSVHYFQKTICIERHLLISWLFSICTTILWEAGYTLYFIILRKCDCARFVEINVVFLPQAARWTAFFCVCHFRSLNFHCLLRRQSMLISWVQMLSRISTFCECIF